MISHNNNILRRYCKLLATIYIISHKDLKIMGHHIIHYFFAKAIWTHVNHILRIPMFPTHSNRSLGILAQRYQSFVQRITSFTCNIWLTKNNCNHTLSSRSFEIVGPLMCASSIHNQEPIDSN